ncbi:MAG: hypothetical protein PHH13_01680 [Candidatus Peribacteraceae bacterium]|nr:hypothetical protein [Candidatus Peribacteraceae bacterium]
MKKMLLMTATLILIGCTATNNGSSIPFGADIGYVAEVIQVGGVGSRSITKNAWNAPTATDSANFDATNLIFTSFNTPGDLMWVSCAEGFTIASCGSPSDNNVILDDAFGCGLGIEDKLKNIVQIECINSAKATDAKPVSKLDAKTTNGAISAENAVSAFYNALSMGNGSKAVQFIIPEKQETGSYVSERMTKYYGGLEQMLKIERIDWVGETQRRVVYTYKEQGKEKCKDMMDVNVTERSNGWFIESIVPRQVCQTESTPPVQIIAQPSNHEPSAVDSKMKCEQFGQQEYEDTHFDDGSIEFEFYYSPTLDTCILQREEYGPGTAYAIMLYDMFTKNMLIHYYNGGEGMKCAAAKAMGQDVVCAKTLEEFNQGKKYLLQNK